MGSFSARATRRRSRRGTPSTSASTWRSGTAPCWASGGETLVWAAFPSDTEYFGRLDQQAMVNYRVRDLEAMLAQLHDTGVSVEGPMEHENGRFGWGIDPEGNRFELWEPVAGQ